jgi:hypothetical protein
MNWRRKTVKIIVPPGNRRGLDSVLEQYVAGGACPEPVEETPEDARKDDDIRRRSR